MEDVIKYEHTSSDTKSKDWLANHTLSQEQFAQLILNKIKRAAIYQSKVDQKFYFDD